MASRSGSSGVSTFVIGFLAGAAAILAIMIVFGGRPAPREVAQDPAPPPAVAPHAVRHAEAARPPEPALPASALPAPDEQVQEDAAAAGMTSRSRSPPGQ